VAVNITVVIPVYRVEAYIERCVRSLMAQTLDEVELVFVDDCSPDDSIAVLRRVLAEYSGQHCRVRILRHEQNRGLPAARNTGLAVATGDYVLHCDSDDYLPPNALKVMYEAACRSDADIVYSDWTLTFPHKQRYMRQPVCTTPAEALHEMLHGRMKWNVWNKLVRRRLYAESGIGFPERHGMGEDLTMVLLMARARSIAYVGASCYHYVRQNEAAFTARPSEQSYCDLLYNARRVADGLQGLVTGDDLACFKLNVKFPLLISGQRADYERWNEWFPEANACISRHDV